jgi:hypothetical protein
MRKQSDDPSHTNAGGRKLRWRDRLRRESAVPAFAVVIVVAAALAAALMQTESDPRDAARPTAVSKVPEGMVAAPPLVVQAPPLHSPPDGANRSASHRLGDPPAPTNALGAAAACRNCGVVESVAMLDRQEGYRMRIRMDDGTVRTIAQRGALPAGSRVLLDGNSVRVRPETTGQG